MKFYQYPGMQQSYGLGMAPGMAPGMAHGMGFGFGTGMGYGQPMGYGMSLGAPMAYAQQAKTPAYAYGAQVGQSFVSQPV